MAKKDPTDLTVEEKLKTLYQLQAALSAIDEKRALRGELPLEVQDLEDEIEGLTTRVEKIQNEIVEFQRAISQKKGEILEAEASVARYKSQLDEVKKTFDVERARCNQLLQRPIKKVAICGGAGDFLLDDAVKAGADAFITGEMHYHQYFGYEQQIQICVIGHYESEQFTVEVFQEIIQQQCPGVKTLIAETNTNPILYL